MKREEREINGVMVNFTENKHGVMIKKCCASCKNHEPHQSDGPKRKCTKYEKIVDKSDCCSGWVISDQINNVKLKP